MSPPDERRAGPAVDRTDSPEAIALTDDVLTIARLRARQQRVGNGRRACRHLVTSRPCHSCRRERIAAQDELRALAREAANVMVASGVPAAMVERRLGIARRSA